MARLSPLFHEEPYIIVEDPLPGGLEALNERLNTTSHDASAQEERFYWHEYRYNQKEVWGDRVVFITEMGTGDWRVTYLARAVRAGRFVALPTEVSAPQSKAMGRGMKGG